jgi:hypothetical protein
MKYNKYCLWLVCIFLFENCNSNKVSDNGESESTYYTIEDFKSISKIDAHVHIRTGDSAFAILAKEHNFRLLTLNTDEDPGIEIQNEFAIQQVQAFPEVVFYATTISVTDWGSDSWEKETIAYLKNSFSRGAVAVKLYKNIGMELKDKYGNLIMVSDSTFDPIINFIVKEHIPLIGHFGEPKNCWLAIDSMTINGDRSYYKRHPEFHMYLHPQYPSYEDQLNAKNEMLDKHPDLKFIGAHLGSLEWNLDSLAAHLDKYSEASVDMAARLSHIQLHAQKNWQKTQDFFIKYQDRILYGTDLIINEKMEAQEIREKVVDKWVSDWTFLSTNEEMVSASFEGIFKGLQLPKGVLDKIYRTNAEKAFLQ